jgi:hypothetical protein
MYKYSIGERKLVNKKDFAKLSEMKFATKFLGIMTLKNPSDQFKIDLRCPALH